MEYVIKQTPPLSVYTVAVEDYGFFRLALVLTPDSAQTGSASNRTGPFTGMDGQLTHTC